MKSPLSLVRPLRPRIFLLAFALTFLSACVGPPPAVPTNIARMKPGARVGLVVTGLDQSAVHVHVGTTIFNNFSTPKTLARHLGDQTSAALSAALNTAGYVTVPIGADAFPGDSLTSTLVASDGAWKVRPERTSDFERLRQELKLDAVVVVTGRRTLARLECHGGPCSERYVEKSGLFSRSILNIDLYFAVPAFEIKLLRLDVPADLSRFDPMASIERARVKQLMGSERPDDPRKVTDAEFAVVTAWIDAYVVKIAAAAVSTLSGPPSTP